MRREALLVIILFATTAGIAAGEHSASACASTVTAIGADSTMLYLVVDHDDDDTWLFEETNAHPSLQRGGHPWYNQSGKTPDSECWDVNLATGEEILDPDFLVL